MTLKINNFTFKIARSKLNSKFVLLNAFQTETDVHGIKGFRENKVFQIYVKYKKV